jgi:hypothetical protein
VFLIQILLPTKTADASRGEARVVRTRAELVERFGGITAYTQTPAHGEWTSIEGNRVTDTVVMVEVLAAVFDRVWWRGYATTLAHRFDQEAIHIRALHVEILDPAAA